MDLRADGVIREQQLKHAGTPGIAGLAARSAARATTGAVQSRFEAIIGQLQVFTENTSAARGRIMDADFAQETSNLSRAQILQQAGTSMVAQANALPQQVLKLLQQ